MIGSVHQKYVQDRLSACFAEIHIKAFKHRRGTRCKSRLITEGEEKRKDRRKKILLNRTFRPHGLPQQNREQGGEGRSYILVPRRDISAPVPGTVKQVRGKEKKWRDRIDACAWRRGRGYIPVPRHQCTGARYGKTSKGSSQNFTHRGQTKELSYGRVGVWTRFVVRSTVKKKRKKKEKEEQLCCGACRVNFKPPKDMLRVFIRSPRQWVHTCERGRSIADVDCAFEGAGRTRSSSTPSKSTLPARF